MSDDPSPASALVDGATLQNLLEATGGDPDFMADLVEEFATDGRAQVAAMRDAAAAQDAAAFTRAAHTLKSTAASFGAAGLAERCRTLEGAAREESISFDDVPLDAVTRDLEDVLAVLSQWATGSGGGA